jgi:sialate O-acetylesterase
VWYQGESNAAVDTNYERLLGGLMSGWRRRFGADLPFLVVQLPNFGAPVAAPTASAWASLREAQRRAVAADAHAGLAVTIDLGDRFELHPPNKQGIGARLARAARHVVYGEAITPSGPRPLGAERAEGRFVVTFGDIDGGLVAYGANQPIGFEVCGVDQASCRFATAAIDGNRVTVTPPDPDAVTRLRYCWGAAPVCTLYDKADLPAGPFEIDVR